MGDYKNLIHKSKLQDDESEEKLLQPYSYLLQVPGKQIRAKLTHAFNYWLDIPNDKLHSVGEIIQMLHNSSLLIDDIQDNSILRRGIPVAHSIFGVASTINAANYVFFLALEKVLALGHPEATTVFTEQMLELHRGQGMEIYWRDNFICPAEEEYKIMTMKKTGGLFMLAVRLMQLFSNNKSDFSFLGGLLGLYFQIRDDYCNLCDEEYIDNKSFCEDLTEGKFGFPIMHAILSRPDDKKVFKNKLLNIDINKINYIYSYQPQQDILRQRPKKVEVKRYCISLLEEFGSFDYTRKVLDDLEKEARTEVARLGGNPRMDSLLDEITIRKRGV